MELTAKRPFLLGSRVVLEGERFETTDTHGKELMARGTAAQDGTAAAQIPPSEVGDPTGMRGSTDSSSIIRELSDMITPTPIADALKEGGAEPAGGKIATAPRAKKAADTKKDA